MRKTFLVGPFLLFFSISFSQEKATIKEYRKTFTTYPFSDPDPVPDVGKIYPYYRFDGYTDKPIQKEWKVVELENDYIKVMILPEVGGKIWAAIEKSTGKPFIYYNHAIKFRDVAMRGPWTSGGIEANYGIIGHTPNCATPVDYTTIEKPDGSVSCVIGVLDLLTRTSWRIDINLEKDKAYFTTTSFWYNASPVEQPYYTWMNTGIKAKGNLEFIYPGTKYLGHEGEYSDWPINKQNGKNISFYENNNFGTYKSYHVFGKYTNFFGAYWHDDDFGFGRYSTHDDKAGKKIWIWGLSQQGMIWEKLLTNTDGQYVEVQSGRLFNQSAEGSTFTPFKHKGFLPHATDTWTEYWFPVLKTKGFVTANNYGALNVKNENGWLKIHFSPVQKINDELKITNGNKTIYSKTIDLKPLQVFADSLQINSASDSLQVTLGNNKLEYDASPDANVLSRPVDTPKDFDWNSVQGLYLQGKEDIRQRFYPVAEEKLKLCLQKDPNYLPALTDYAMLLYRDMRYEDALTSAKKALSIDTYDPAANYYYGLINEHLGNTTDAKDGFDIASMGMEYRSAAYTELSKIYFKENKLDKAIDYAHKSIDFNHYAIDACKLLAVIYRLQNEHEQAINMLDTLLSFDPLNHFARFEKYQWNNSDNGKQQFVDMIRNEMPQQTFLELAIWYYNLGRKGEAEKILELSPKDAEVQYWLAFLKGESLNANNLKADLVFPFRPETAEVLKTLIKKNDQWLLKYHLALLHWSYNNIDSAKNLFEQCGDQPNYAPFYAARAKFETSDSTKTLADLRRAMNLDKNDWRYGRDLINYYFTHKEFDSALTLSTKYNDQFPRNYVIGMLYIKALIANKQYDAADKNLKAIDILPNEGATDGRRLYEETKLMLALQAMQKKNYKQSLNYVAAAREWPENLGVGKPYESNIDERLEDWLAYQNYFKMRDKRSAQEMIDKIVSFTNARENLYPSANDLISAWAMQQQGNKEQGEKFLQQQNQKKSNNEISAGALNTYEGKNFQLPEDASTNNSYKVLQLLLKMQ